MSAYPRLLFWYQFLAIALPAAGILYLVSQTGPLPDNDYWDIFAALISGDGFTASLESWLARSNEHIVLLPKLLYVANYLVTAGSNTGLALIAFTTALLLVLSIRWLFLPPVLAWDARLGILALLVTSVFVFTPGGAHNWLMGMSGVAWISSNLFAVLAIGGLFRLGVTQRSPWLFFSLGAGVAGTLTYSTSLAVWPTLALGAWYLRLSSRVILGVVVCGILIYAAYVSGYQRNPYHPELTFSLLPIAEYTLSFLGGIFTNDAGQAGVYGLIGLLAALALSTYLVLPATDTNLRLITAPWVLVGIYAFGNALLAALTRSGFGTHQALESRYASLPALFWASLFIAALIVAWRLRPQVRKYTAGVLIAIIGVAAGAMHHASLDPVQRLLQREQDKHLAAVSLVTHAYDPQLLRRVVSPMFDIHRLQDTYAKFEGIGHVPFVKPYTSCATLGRKLQSEALSDTDPSEVVKGHFDELITVDRHTARVRGWAYSEQGPVTCIAITDEETIVRGAALTGFARPDVAAALRISAHDTGWIGYARLPDPSHSLQAWALAGGGQDWYTLGPVQRTPPP